MIYNSTVLKNEYKKASSNSVELNIFRVMHMALALIIIAWMNNDTFTYTIPYVPNYIRGRLFLAWFCLTLTSNKKFVKTFAVQY